MESPPPFFHDYVDLEDDGTSYPGSFDDGLETATTYDQPFNQAYKNNTINGDVSFSASSKLPTPKLGTWDGTVTTTELCDPDLVDIGPQQMFVQPRTYLTEQDTMTRTARRDVKRTTPSTTPELQPSSRRSLSIKSESRSSDKSVLDKSTDITPPEPTPPKRRRTARKTKKEMAANAEEDDKRSKFLARNRIAASKCREKKKMYVVELEENKSRLESEHMQLQLEYHALLNEVGSLKHDLMTHAKCNDPNIDRWISNEATKFVQTANALGNNPYAGSTAMSVGPGSLAHRRNSSAASITIRPGGYGSFSSTTTNPDISYTRDRHNSIVESTHPSPTDGLFPSLESPTAINFDHMPDDMFRSDR